MAREYTAAIKVDPATIRLIWMKALENKDWAADDADLYAIEASAKISTMTVGGYALNFNMNTYPVAMVNLVMHRMCGGMGFMRMVSWAL